MFDRFARIGVKNLWTSSRGASVRPSTISPWSILSNDFTESSPLPRSP